LRPALQGFRLVDGRYERMSETEDGSLLSEELGLRLVLEDGQLRLYDRVTGRHC
jgi:Uma2 family endonuclease